MVAAWTNSCSPTATAKDAGIDVAPLQRFMKCEQTLRLPTAEKLCKVVGLDLVPAKKTKRR